MRRLARYVTIGVLTAAAVSEVLAREAARPSVTVGVIFDAFGDSTDAFGVHEDDAPAIARIVPALIAEADEIWRPVGVRIVPATKSPTPPEDVRLTLNFGTFTAKGASTNGLGAIWFDEEGAPGDTITIDVAAVRLRVAQTTLNHRPLADWPPALADQVLGRALGRVLAHEVGHYLLRSKMHQPRGLMKPVFTGADLGAWDRTRFALDAAMLRA